MIGESKILPAQVHKAPVLALLMNYWNCCCIESCLTVTHSTVGILAAIVVLMHVQIPDLQLGPAARFANDSQLFFPVAALLESSVPDESKGALQVCNPSNLRYTEPHSSVLIVKQQSSW